MIRWIVVLPLVLFGLVFLTACGSNYVKIQEFQATQEIEKAAFDKVSVKSISIRAPKEGDVLARFGFSSTSVVHGVRLNPVHSTLTYFAGNDPEPSLSQAMGHIFQPDPSSTLDALVTIGVSFTPGTDYVESKFKLTLELTREGRIQLKKNYYENEFQHYPNWLIPAPHSGILADAFQKTLQEVVISMQEDKELQVFTQH